MNGETFLKLLHGAATNGWKIEGFTTEPPAEGHVPHGYVMFDRERYPFEGRGYGTARWYYHPENGLAGYEQGHYDLTREEALEDLAQRAGVSVSPEARRERRAREVLGA